MKVYRRLGRTGFDVSDISLGTGAIRGENGEAIVREAIERGINYLDTAPDYAGSGSEQAIGRAMRGQDRSQLFLATKFCTPGGHLPAGASGRGSTSRSIEASLSRLGTDYIDLVHVHSCDEIERLMDPNMHQAFDQLRQEGKARFLGFSSHTPNLAQVATQAIESDRFDVMMLAYHHGIWPSLGELIQRARDERDMGIVAMKTLKGARHNGLVGFRENAQAYSQAAFKWVLSNPDVALPRRLVLRAAAPRRVHLRVRHRARRAPITRCSSATTTRSPAPIARRIAAPVSITAPRGSPSTTSSATGCISRTTASRSAACSSYAQLGKNASVCVGCAAPCTGHCPVGIPIQQRMSEAHELLSIT